MLDYKPCSNPSSFNHHLVLSNSPLLPDPTAYRSLVGALQYMTFTRPNLSYAIQQACLFMSKSIHHHLVAAKRIMRYRRGLLSLGITFELGSLSLLVYCDVD